MVFATPLQRTSLVAILSLLVATRPAGGAEPSEFRAADAEGARLFFEGPIPIAVLSGSPEEIGRQHAALMGKPAKAIMNFPRRFANRYGGEALWPLAAIAGQMLVNNAPADHRAELASLAEHGKLAPSDLAVANTMLELRRMGCSALIVEPEHSAANGPLFGRNFDFPPLDVLDKHSVLVICRPTSKRAFASIVFPGGVGALSGMNDGGLCVATLDVERTGDGAPMFNPQGDPLCFVIRRLLEECTTVVEVQKLLESITATTCMNLAVCDRDEGAVFEITPKHIARRDDAGDCHVVGCTNHFVTEGLTVHEDCERLPRLESAADEPPLDVEAVHRRLDAVNQGWLTLQTMIFEPRELVVHLAFGKPPVSDDPLTRIELEPLFTGKESRRIHGR